MIAAAKSFPAPSIDRLIFAIGSLGRASVLPLDVPFDQKANPNGFEFMGLMPARASPSRPLVSVAFGSLPTPRRFAAPCGQPLNALLFRAGLCAPRSRARCMAFKPRRKELHMSEPTNRPSHRVYAVTKNGEHSFWQPIGGAWVHSDGWGFNLKLDYLPLNGAEIVIRKPKVEETDAPAGEAA
jgi:hypothetical protein